MFYICKVTRNVRSHSIRRFGISAALVAAIFLPSLTRGQGTTASLGGVVTDATGAVIPGATVVVTNEASGDKRTVQSNGAGIFSLSALPVGNYQVDITATGFTGFEQKDV
ncbi:MAG TPA: carboxypeptidase-like regulatory domain-containing protein, partial [Terracidiphilus sp.]